MGEPGGGGEFAAPPVEQSSGGSGDGLAGVPQPVRDLIQPGDRVYTHKQGSTIIVTPDGSVFKYGPDGKPKKTSATAAKLAVGHGAWEPVEASVPAPVKKPTEPPIESKPMTDLKPDKALVVSNVVEPELPSKPTPAGAKKAVPMTFNEAPVAEVPQYIADPNFHFQQKVDGIRGQLVIQPGKAPWFRSKSGEQLQSSTAAKIVDPMLKSLGTMPEGGPTYTVDGELLDGKWYVFDLAVEGGEKQPWSERMTVAENWVNEMHKAGLKQIQALPTARTPEEKQALWDSVNASGGEGVMMKRTDAPYDYGKRVNHTLKAKITSTADVVVMDRNVNGKENAVIGLRGPDGQLNEIGTVSMLGKEKNGKVNVGDVIEVEYLWANPANNNLQQPRMVKLRPDKSADQATTNQLRFVSKDIVDINPDAVVPVDEPAEPAPPAGFEVPSNAEYDKAWGHLSRVEDKPSWDPNASQDRAESLQTQEYPVHFGVAVEDARHNALDYAVDRGFAAKVKDPKDPAHTTYVPAPGITDGELDAWATVQASRGLEGILDSHGYDREGNLYDFNQSNLDQMEADAAEAAAADAAAAEAPVSTPEAPEEAVPGPTEASPGAADPVKRALAAMDSGTGKVRIEGDPRDPAGAKYTNDNVPTDKPNHILKLHRTPEGWTYTDLDGKDRPLSAAWPELFRALSAGEPKSYAGMQISSWGEPAGWSDRQIADAVADLDLPRRPHPPYGYGGNAPAKDMRSYYEASRMWNDAFAERLAAGGPPKVEVQVGTDASDKDLNDELARLSRMSQAAGAVSHQILDDSMRRALNSVDHFRDGTSHRDVDRIIAAAQPLRDEMLRRTAARFTPGREPGYDGWDSVKQPSTTTKYEGGMTQQLWDSARNTYVGKDKNTTDKNSSLRSSSPSAAAKTWRGRMDRWIKSNRTTSDSRTYRGIAVPPSFLEQIRPGAVITDPGIVSTDSSEGGAAGYLDARIRTRPDSIPVMLEVNIPAGTPLADADYGEFVLPSNTPMVVREVRRDDNGTYRVTVEPGGQPNSPVTASGDHRASVRDGAGVAVDPASGLRIRVHAGRLRERVHG